MATRTNVYLLIALAGPILGCGCVSTPVHAVSTACAAESEDSRIVVRSAEPTADSEPNRAGQEFPGKVRLGTPQPLILAEATSLTKSSDEVAEHSCLASDAESWFQRDKVDFLADMRCDLESLVNRQNAIMLLAAGGVSYAFHELLDDDLAANTARHENRWGNFQDVVEVVGNPITQIVAASGVYAYGLLKEDVELHEVGKTLLHATAITTVTATLLKFAANTERPNGDPRGWPSGHTASSFAVAAVLDEYYGCKVAIPAYALAGLVAWERIDDREHDLSDVVFGAALGFVIGRTVAAEHQHRFCGMQVEPFVDPVSGATGVAFEKQF